MPAATPAPASSIGDSGDGNVRDAAPTAAPAPASVPDAVATTHAVPRTLSVPPSPQETLLFPRPDILKPAIAFWTNVFQKYSENQSVVHDMSDLGKVYAVLDFSEPAATMERFRFTRYRAETERDELNHIAGMLKHVAALSDHPEQMSSDERRIYGMFGNSHDPRRYREAIDNLRVQRGVRERTEHALEVATGYWPVMEKTFTSYGLPMQLTRLPLVESSFNLNAYSKDGAAGIWQFIPSSARIYMRLNSVVDDRRDPWLSTDAAARHLRDDYAALHDWPLAVTAYNHGRGGLARGLAQVGGTSLTDLLQRYHNANFGFASRNFYAEFLAATDVARAYRSAYAPLAERAKSLQFDTFTTSDYVRYETLRRLAGVDEDTFRTLNPAYRPEVVSGRLLIPPGHEIRVPLGSGERVRAAYAALASDERFSRQRDYYQTYCVQRGDSIGKIARRFRVSTAALRSANGIKRGGNIHVGDVIHIPSRGVTVASAGEAAPSSGSAHLVATAAVKKPAAQTGYRSHRVRPGQTLSDIAHRYGTDVDTLRSLNSLKPNQVLRVGTKLKIPNE